MELKYIREGMTFSIYSDLLRRIEKEFILPRFVEFTLQDFGAVSNIFVYYKEEPQFVVVVAKNTIQKIIKEIVNS